MPRWLRADVNLGWPVLQSGARERKVFVFATAAAVAAVVGFVAWLEFRIGGDTVTIAVDDIGEFIAAFIAAAGCGVAARQASGRQRLGWTLLATSAAAWGADAIQRRPTARAAGRCCGRVTGLRQPRR